MLKKSDWSRALAALAAGGRCTARLAPLMAMTIAGTLFAAVPQRAQAQERSTETADVAGTAVTAVTTVATEPQTAASAPQIEEVVVTATKRAENVREIPASIVSVAGAELEQRGAQDTADIVKLVPGVNLTATGDSPPRVTIRGISSDIGTSSTTGVLFGNVSFTETYAPVVALDPNPFDMASVEVLKGPQGTLYGASALNGAIRYVPTTPRFGEYEVKYFGQYTWINKGDAAPTYGAAVNLPLVSDEVALRVMAFDRTAPGYIDNTRTGEKDVNQTDQQGARALLGWRPNESWDVLLTTAWQSTKYRDVGIADNDEGRLESADRARPSPNHVEYSLVDLNLSYDAEWAQLVSDTSYIDKKGRNFFDASSRITGNGAIPLTAQTYAGDSETYAQEFRLVSPDDTDSRWKWVAGVSAFQQDMKNLLSVPLALELTPAATIIDALGPLLGGLFAASGSPLVVQTEADVKVKELAAFGEVTRKLGDEERLEVTLGGRLYRTSSGGDNVQSGLYAELINALQGRPVPYTLSAKVEEEGFNPKASVLYHFNDDILAYGLVSKGFRVGGVQTGITSNSIPDTFKSDTLWNYEVGLRTQLLDNTLRVDLTGFRVDWKNPQTLQPDPSGLAVYIDNVGGVRSQGGDLSLQYLFPWSGLMFTTSVSYADTVTTADFSNATGDTYAKGSNWPLAPKWQTASNLSFMRAVGDWLLGGFATYTTIGSAVPTFGAHEVFGYRQTDLQLSVSNERIKWLPELALIVNNLTDERGLTNAFTSGVPSEDLAAQEYYYITPRAFILRVSGRFGG